MWLCLKESCICGKRKSLAKKRYGSKKRRRSLLRTLRGRMECQSNHSQNLSFKKHNKPQLLPITSDLLALRAFLNEKILELTDEVEKNPMQENWRKLANSALTRLIMFNKRRGKPNFFMFNKCTSCKNIV